MLLLSAATYAGEFAAGVILLIRPHLSACVNGLCYIVVASFAVGLARAWSLMRANI
jgi:hypothetical protein